MNLFGTIARGALAPAEAKIADISALTWSALLGQPSSRSGVSVSVDSSLKTTTVLACLRVLSEDVAGMPIEMLRVDRADGSYSFAFDHPVWKLIARRPNEWMRHGEFIEAGMLHAGLTGNAHWYINRIGKPERVAELIPLLPGRVHVRQLPDCTILYDVSLPSGEVLTLPRTDIMHLRGPSWGTVIGLDIMHCAREAIGLAIATEETHAMLHRNGVQPGGILKVNAGLMDEKRKEALREAFSEQFGGVHRAFRVIVADAATDFTQFQMKGVDAQHLETRMFQAVEICRAMRVFPQMVGITDKTATFASAEAFFTGHVVYSLMPWVRRWSEMFACDLWPDEIDIEAHFSVHELMRGDMKAQGEFFQKALGAGGAPAWMTQDEVRRRLRLNPRGGTADALAAGTNPTAGSPDPTSGRDADTASARLDFRTTPHEVEHLAARIAASSGMSFG